MDSVASTSDGNVVDSDVLGPRQLKNKLSVACVTAIQSGCAFRMSWV